MKLIAHRGFAGEAPENTVRAMRHAVDRGADAVEFDVRGCRSGGPVVVHDATVDRVTGGSGTVAEMTDAELADLDVLGSGVGIPTLDAVLEAVPPAVGVNAELKDPVGTRPLRRLSEAPNDVLVSSFDPAMVDLVAEADPSLDTALLSASDRLDPVSRARELDCAAVHPETSLVTPEFVDRAHEAGLRVNAWTVEDGETVDRLRAAGVDGVIADRADVV